MKSKKYEPYEINSCMVQIIVTRMEMDRYGVILILEVWTQIQTNTTRRPC